MLKMLLYLGEVATLKHESRYLPGDKKVALAQEVYQLPR
jgi:hypothetical protein